MDSASKSAKIFSCKTPGFHFHCTTSETCDRIEMKVGSANENLAIQM